MTCRCIYIYSETENTQEQMRRNLRKTARDPAIGLHKPESLAINMNQENVQPQKENHRHLPQRLQTTTHDHHHQFKRCSPNSQQNGLPRFHQRNANPLDNSTLLHVFLQENSTRQTMPAPRTNLLFFSLQRGYMRDTTRHPVVSHAAS